MLDGRVAIVTGAARGLGRVEALELARLGARVVVNDLGTTADGAKDEEPARAVVEEIKSLGGEAVPHFGDVADWNYAQSLIQAAVDEFGDLNILVNNAGFLRDKMIFNMTEEEWDSIIRVHLKGHFSTMRFASSYWRDKSKAAGAPVYGRLVSTSSESFIFGNAGQPNYAAAKAGIVALTMSAAQALFRYGVTANVIMPRARTRLNDTGTFAAMFAKPAEGFDTFAAENVSPLVGYLASPQAERISGQVFVVWGKSVTVVGRPSTDTSFESEVSWSVENLHEQLGPHYEKLEPVTDGFIVPAT
ncbi:MAG: SDR family NAD(P)-dependent oxidoreductase [Deltaproteobacteria bacterium]|nr:SDR family NAD(P)-dependent oxidoreductase [Deltaproteobacteria bacterium]